MFGWRRKNDGFVWNEYVRTTILLRREQRKQRIEDVRDAAVDGIKQASRQGVALGVAGANAAGRGVWAGFRATAATLGDWISVVASACWLWLADRAQPVTETLSFGASRAASALNRPAAATPLLLIAAVAALSATVRWNMVGFDRDATIAAIIATLCSFLAAIPWAASQGFGGRVSAALDRVPYIDRLRQSSPGSSALASAAGIGVMLALVVGALSWLGPALMSNSGGALEQSSPAPVMTAASGRIEGKAVATGPADLRVGGDIVHLFGVEAPASGQSCAASKSCTAAAKAALQKLVGGKRVACEVSGRQADSSSSAKCEINGADIAGQLVRGGHVFATTGLFAPYASAEREARANKVGIWRTNTLRPAEFRAKQWDDAKQSAPNNCPIKGTISGDTKSYVLPWSPAYDKAKVRTERGERWFCSETDARAAGWKSSDAS